MDGFGGLGDFGSRAAGGAGEAKAQRVIGRVGESRGLFFETLVGGRLKKE